MEVFLKARKSVTCNKIISRLWKGYQQAKLHNTQYVKHKRENVAVHPKLEGKTLESIYEADFPFQFDTLFLRNISYELCDNSDKKLMLMLLVPKKKKPLREMAKKPESVTVDEWIDVVHDIYMSWKNCLRLFGSRKMNSTVKRSTWTESVKPAQSGFC